VAVSRDQRHYANYVMSRIGDSGIRDVEIVHADRPVPAELNALIAREVPFAVVAGPNDEANRTVSISLLKRSPPEGMC
jgi:threonyl-tRNA synthetase